MKILIVAFFLLICTSLTGQSIKIDCLLSVNGIASGDHIEYKMRIIQNSNIISKSYEDSCVVDISGFEVSTIDTFEIVASDSIFFQFLNVRYSDLFEIGPPLETTWHFKYYNNDSQDVINHFLISAPHFRKLYAFYCDWGNELFKWE